MTLKKKHTGLWIGTIFSLVSLALTFTFIIPIWSVLLGSFVEQAFSALFPYAVFAEIGKLTILLLSILLLSVVFLVFKAITLKVKKGIIIRTSFIGLVMLATYVVVHPLGFYLYLGLVLDFQLDAQYLFDAVYSFPFSSLFFILFGFVLDRVEGNARRLNTKSGRLN